MLGNTRPRVELPEREVVRQGQREHEFGLRLSQLPRRVRS